MDLEKVVEKVKKEYPGIQIWIDDDVINVKLKDGTTIEYYFDPNDKRGEKYAFAREVRIQPVPDITEHYSRIGYTSLSPYEFIIKDLKKKMQVKN